MAHGHGGHGHHGHGGGGRWNDWGFFGLPYAYGYPGACSPYLPQGYPGACAPQLASYGAAALARPTAYNAMMTSSGADAMLAPVAMSTPQLALPGPLGGGGVVTPLAFRSRKIRAHKTRTVVARPLTFFQPQTLFIPRRVARHFDIKNIRVGLYSAFLPRSSVPAELYSNEGCIGPAFIQLPPAVPGQYYYMTVKNRSHSSRHFRAVLNGISSI